jgi:hypothetical protein
MAVYFRCLMARLEMLTSGSMAFLHNRHSYLIPLFLVVTMLLLPVLCMVWLAGLPYEFWQARQQHRRKKLEREIQAEGRDMYPLW